MINKNNVFALVHLNWEGLQILELGDKKFILEKYFWWKEQLAQYQKEDCDDLCIMSYGDENTVECVCNRFDTSVSKVKGL